MSRVSYIISTHGALSKIQSHDHSPICLVGLPRWCSGQESACQCRRHKRCRFSPWVGKIPWRRKWQPTPVFLAGEFHGLRSLVGYTPLGHKESDMTEQLSARFGKPLANSQGEKTLWGKHTPTHSPKHFFPNFCCVVPSPLVYSADET